MGRLSACGIPHTGLPVYSLLGATRPAQHPPYRIIAMVAYTSSLEK